jgi:predicted transcriptional regulator
VFIGLFVYLGAGGEAAYARMQSALSGLTVNDALMSRFTELSPEDTIGKATDALLKSQETAFVILDAGKPTGLLTRDEIIRGLTEAGPDAPVAHFASDQFTVVDAGNSLKKVFEELLRAEHTVAIVTRGGEVAGLIDRNNVEEKILINEALTKYAQGHELKFRRT